MQKISKLGIAVLVAVVPFAGGTTPTSDSLTKLPLIPSAGEVMELPASQMCKSRMLAAFYPVKTGKMSVTIAWYGAHLTGFQKTHAYGVDRSQDAFYNADRTVAVSITGEPGKNGEDTNAGSVVYARFQPGLSEKEMISLNASHLVCQ
jgi:hypothetical protein